LGQLWSLRADDGGAALPVLHYPVTTTAAAQHPRGHRQPAEDAPRPDGHDIQQPVIHPGRGHQHQPGEKLAAVADHHRADLTGRVNPAIHGEGDRGPGGTQRAHSGDEIRQRAQPGLQLVGCTGHDCRGKAHPGHHHKHLLFGAVVDEHPPDVDRAVFPGQRNPGGFGRVIQPKGEVAGQQVGGTHGDQAQRGARAGEDMRHVADGAISAAGEHHIRAGGQRGSGLTATRILDGGLKPQRWRPPQLRAHPGDLGVQLRQVIDVDRVDHHCGQWAVRQ
jgi:hypothetical protein